MKYSVKYQYIYLQAGYKLHCILNVGQQIVWKLYRHFVKISICIISMVIPAFWEHCSVRKKCVFKFKVVLKNEGVLKIEEFCDLLF